MVKSDFSPEDHGRAHRRERVLAIFLIACVTGFALPASGATGCVQTATFAPQIRSEVSSAATQQNPDTDSRNKELRRPFDASEVRAMLDGLRPVRLKTNDGWTFSALAQQRDVDFERVGAVFSDAVALLTHINSREALEWAQSVPSINPEQLDWLQNTFDSIRICVEARFEDFGGEPVFHNSINIVRELRGELEELLLAGFDTKLFTVPKFEDGGR